MNTWKQTYEKWEQFAQLDKSLKAELATLTEPQREDAFYRNLEFGTAGMRGVLGVGTNRMNIYTIAKANAGFAQYIVKQGKNAQKRGIVIAYDSRFMSEEFAKTSALVMASAGVKVYLFESLCSTPELSFTVRHLHAFAGIVITASHNPKEYNGYKIYDDTGCQFIPKIAELVVENVENIDNELAITTASFTEYQESGLIEIIGDAIDRAYNDAIVGTTFQQVPTDEVSVVYTALHGTGYAPIKRAFDTLGYTNIHYELTQCQPDPTFGDVPLPNPEDPAVFEASKIIGKQVGADILLATDPDADRLGIAIRDKQGNYELLNGNMTGALMTYYILSSLQEHNQLPANGVIFTTIVSSDFAQKIAAHFNVETEKTLTGFKFIGSKIKQYETTKEKTFLFGFEESYGSLVNADIARDKDAVQAVVILTEMVAYYKTKGKTLLDVLESLQQQFGYFVEGLENISLSGKTGAEKIAHLMATVANDPFTEICGQKVVIFENYINSTRKIGETTEGITLPKADVLKFILANGTWFCLRPSGTEPKAKVYISVTADQGKTAKGEMEALRGAIMEQIKGILA
ncbi:MAG: phospho-sugar mutase [Culicoidibacterales bacterium]